jgi:PleD family two-component response regulator
MIKKNQIKQAYILQIQAPISIRLHFLGMAAHNKDNINNINSASHSSITLSGNPRKILIVDDEPDITSTFDMILQMNGFELYKKNKRY